MPEGGCPCPKKHSSDCASRAPGAGRFSPVACVAGVDIFPHNWHRECRALFGSLALVIDPSARTCAAP